MAFINVDKLNFNGEFAKNIWEGIKDFFTLQPNWLKGLLVSAVIVWAFYFTYNWFNKKQNIKELQQEVQVINEKMDNILSNEKYQENLIFVITEIQLLQQAEQQSYNDELLQIDLSIQFISRHHPNDPAIHDLNAMKLRLQISHDAYQQHYNHVMDQLKKAIVNE